MPAALLDTNVLIHAAYEETPLHAHARCVLDQALTDAGRYCIAPQNMVEFAAVVSKKRRVHQAMPPSEIATFASVLYRSRILKKIYPKRATVMRAIREGARLGLTDKIWYDMYLALTMRDAGVSVIVTEDLHDYARFPFVTAIGIEEAARETGETP